MRPRNSILGRLAAGLTLAGTIGCAAERPAFDPSGVRPYPGLAPARTADASVVRVAQE